MVTVKHDGKSLDFGEFTAKGAIHKIRYAKIEIFRPVPHRKLRDEAEKINIKCYTGLRLVTSNMGPSLGHSANKGALEKFPCNLKTEVYLMQKGS